jgi:hypothetical protein
MISEKENTMFSHSVMNCRDDEEKFWAESPCDLLTDLSIVPVKTMTMDQKLNALTRLLIVVSVICYFLGYSWWYILLLVGLVVIVFFKYTRKGGKREGFSIPPTNLVGSQLVTTIPPVLGEQWESPLPTYNSYQTMVDGMPDCSIPPTFDESAFPVYGQYYQTSSLQPFRSEEVRNKSLVDATVQLTDAWTYDQLQHRNDLTRNFTNSLNRTWRNGCFDAISPIP